MLIRGQRAIALAGQGQDRDASSWAVDCRGRRVFPDLPGQAREPLRRAAPQGQRAPGLDELVRWLHFQDITDNDHVTAVWRSRLAGYGRVAVGSRLIGVAHGRRSPIVAARGGYRLRRLMTGWLEFGRSDVSATAMAGLNFGLRYAARIR